ncbi:MAG: tyrosine-type recombinase/integrase [Candidatus Humimicrobiaceae bacterium]
MFRYTKAMHLLQANVNLVYIRDLLGHVNVSTTEIYARADAEMKRLALGKAYVEVVTDEIPAWNDDVGLISWLQNFCKQ